MVLGILTSIAACPAIIGTTEAVRHGQRQNQREEQRGRKCNLTVSLYRQSEYSPIFNGARVVLKNNKLYVDVRKASTDDLHPFEGYFLPYPDRADDWRAQGFSKGEGMVTTISHDPPFLNWVFVDRDTHAVKYGIRKEADPNRTGPFDCTKFDRRITFEGWEGFLAVQEEEESGLWALYFDCDDDGLHKIGVRGKKLLQLEIWRKELRMDRVTAVEERVERLQLRKEHEENGT